MYSQLSLFLLFISVTVGLTIKPIPIRKQISSEITNSSTRGVVEGIAPCGAPISPEGRVLEVRVSDCTKLPCSCIIDQSYTIEIDFIPSESHPSLNVYLAIIVGGNDYPVINQDVPITLEAGLPYSVQFPVLITPGFGTGLVAIRVLLGEGTVVEVCGIGTADIHP